MTVAIQSMVKKMFTCVTLKSVESRKLEVLGTGGFISINSLDLIGGTDEIYKPPKVIIITFKHSFWARQRNVSTRRSSYAP